MATWKARRRKLARRLEPLAWLLLGTGLVVAGGYTAQQALATGAMTMGHRFRFFVTRAADPGLFWTGVVGSVLVALLGLYIAWVVVRRTRDE